MANEMSWRGVTTGVVDYFTVRRATDNKMWNTSGTPAFETLVVGNWTSYAIAMTETPASSYFYVGTWPAGVSTAGWYYVDVYRRAGGSAAISDQLVGTIYGWWNGTKFEPAGGDVAQVAATAQTARDLGNALPASTAGGKGGLPILDMSLGYVLTGYNNAAVTTEPSNMTDVTKLVTALVPISGSVVDASPTTTSFKTNLTLAADNFHKGMSLIFYGASALAGQSAQIKAEAVTNGVVTLQSALTAAPTNGDQFYICNTAVARIMADIISAHGSDYRPLVSANQLTANGNMPSSLKEILTTALSEDSAGLLAGGLKKFLNVTSPTGTLNSLPAATPGAQYGLPILLYDAGSGSYYLNCNMILMKGIYEKVVQLYNALDHLSETDSIRVRVAYKDATLALSNQEKLDAAAIVAADPGLAETLALIGYRLEYDLTASKAYIWNAGGTVRLWMSTLTDKDGAPVTATTTGPINRSKWIAYV